MNDEFGAEFDNVLTNSMVLNHHGIGDPGELMKRLNLAADFAHIFRGHGAFIREVADIAKEYGLG